MSYQIRDVDLQSVPYIHEMNEGSLPHVNSVTLEYFRAQVGSDSYFRAAYGGGDAAAFLLAMSERADYDSMNFLWFKDRYPRFIYIDRVIVGEGHRRAGLGASLYADLVQWASLRRPLLACEVNLRPSNEPSLRFHGKQGFTPVGTQETDGGRKTVSLMIRKLAGWRMEHDTR